MKCIECNGLGITIFVLVTHDAIYDGIKFDSYICTACHGSGEQSLLKNLLWRWKHKDAVAEGGVCLVHFLSYPPIAFGGVLNSTKPLPDEMLQSLKTLAKEKAENVKRPTKTV